MQQPIATVPGRSSPAADQQRPKPEKERRISKRLAEAVRLLGTGECKTTKAAAERTGLNYTHLCEALKKPHVRVFCEQHARQTIANGLLRASNVMVELLDAKSEHVAADMARHVAAIHGIKPATDPQVSVNLAIKAGYVIDLSEPGEDRPMKTINEVAGP